MKIDHELKIWPEYFKDIKKGDKTFEIRSTDDRLFKAGQMVKLREYSDKYKEYSGKTILIKIIYVSDALQKPGMVVFSFEKLKSKKMVTIALSEFLMIMFCTVLVGVIIGNIWGSDAVRATIKKTQTAAVPGILLDITKLDKDLDYLHKAIFGKARKIKEVK